MNEFEQKQETLRLLMAQHRVDALLLQKVSSFAWATCGAASYINAAVSDGTASLLLTPNGRYLITTNIELPRLANEEGLSAQGWEMRPAPWHGDNPAVAELSAGLRLAADGFYPGAVDLSGPVGWLRSILLPEEQERFRQLGKLCAAAMEETIQQVHPGLSEHEIAALLAYACEKRGVQAPVNLIATDERIFQYRHPLPTAKKMERYALVVLCGRKWGLVCSITRLVHFGALPEEISIKEKAVAAIDAAFIAHTRPGATLGEIFARALAVYAETGFADEWRLHHQGGPAGYEPREVVATPGDAHVVVAGQTYAWNPSITGAKSEDTILVTSHGHEVLSEIPGWPVHTVTVNGQALRRPAILQVK